MLVQISELTIRRVSSVDVIKKYVVQHMPELKGDRKLGARPRPFSNGVRTQRAGLVAADDSGLPRPSHQVHRSAESLVRGSLAWPGNRVVEVQHRIPADVSEFKTAEWRGTNSGRISSFFHPINVSPPKSKQDELRVRDFLFHPDN